jgi:hypothetical protein
MGGAAFAVLATPAAALELDLKSTAPTGRGAVVGSIADLTFNTSDLQSSLEIGVEAGRATDGGVDAYGAPLSGERSKWSSGRLSLRQVWTPLDNARFELDAAGGGRRDIDQTSRIGSGMGRQTGEASADFTGRYAPIANLSLELSAGSSSRTDESFSLATGSLGKDLSSRSSRQASAAVSFTPLPRLKLEARSRMSAVDLAWSRGSLPVRGAYGFAEPQMSATLSLWDGASWRVGALRTVAAPSPDQFIRYADAFGPAAARNFRPDPEWRYDTNV